MPHPKLGPNLRGPKKSPHSGDAVRSASRQARLNTNITNNTNTTTTNDNTNYDDDKNANDNNNANNDTHNNNVPDQARGRARRPASCGRFAGSSARARDGVRWNSPWSKVDFSLE